MQYNLCIVDTLRLFISVLTIRVYLIIQVSLQVHAKAHFGSITISGFILGYVVPQACYNLNLNSELIEPIQNKYIALWVLLSITKNLVGVNELYS